MLKSYEAVYQNGHLHWMGMPPPREIENHHVMVVVDLERKTAKPTTDILNMTQHFNFHSQRICSST